MNWQDTITLAIVAVAAAFLLRRAWLTIFSKKAGGCGSCGSCAKGGTTDELPIVQIGSKN